jgi:hypothetical protein
MKYFIKRLVVFFVPIALVFVFLTLILFISKENFHNPKVTINNKEKYIVGYGYNEDNYKYIKWKNLVESEQNYVVALGSSRVLQFRSNMFDTSFYNAGYTIASIGDFVPFLSSIPTEKLPKFLIIGLDQWMFNKNYDDLKTIPNSDLWKNSFTFFPSVQTYKLLINDIYNGKVGSAIFNNNNKIGMNATFKNTGFRNDGSMLYGLQIQKLLRNDTTASDFKFKDTYKRIELGNRRFEYGNTANANALLELDKLLKFSKSFNINVVAFLPPFAKSVLDELESSKKYKYIFELESLLTPYFKKYDFELHNYTKITNCNSGDYETIDGFHGSEVTYHKMLLDMLRKKSILNQVTDSNKLKSDLIHKRNNYTVYQY